MKWTTEAKVGTVTLLGVVLLAYMIIHLGGFSWGEKGYPLQVRFTQVSGLKEGNAVRYAGVDVGLIKRVEVQADGVMVTMGIQHGIKIPAGAKFTIGADGLLGEKFINILPPPQVVGYLTPGSVVVGQDHQGIEELVSSADKVLKDARELIRSLNDIVGDEAFKQALKETAFNARDLTANLNAMSASLARMAQNNEGDVTLIVRNLRAMSEGLNSVAAKVDRMVSDVDNNGQTAKDLRETIHNLQRTSVRVEKMAESLEGIVTDPETAKNIKETLRNARQASEKANKLLTKVENIKVQPGVEVLYNQESGKYSADLDVKINTSAENFAVLGASNIGQGTKGNFQLGKENDKMAARAGIIDSQLGVGVDAKLGPMRLSVDAYDPNDIRLKLRAQYKIGENTYLVGERDAANKSDKRADFIGVRQNF
ncbi:MlaD family protein [Azotosporobacter soli]|uniref:MlaD family protein n=1 Tax=Azotosporobacter soli TaxID=3055040 RepID=UPI0031FEBC86